MIGKRTYMAKPGEVERRWWIIDATDLPLGRLSTEIAMLLRGKRKAQFTPHVDTGDFVVVINAVKVGLTGKKLSDKMYYHHSGFLGGLKTATAKQMLERHPDRIIRQAVWGMLPKNTLSRHMLKKLKVYGGAEHPHEAQQPAAYNVKL